MSTVLIPLAFCCPAGLALYWILVRPFFRSLTDEIPTSRKYWAGVHPAKRAHR